MLFSKIEKIWLLVMKNKNCKYYCFLCSHSVTRIALVLFSLYLLLLITEFNVTFFQVHLECKSKHQSYQTPCLTFQYEIIFTETTTFPLYFAHSFHKLYSAFVVEMKWSFWYLLQILIVTTTRIHFQHFDISASRFYPTFQESHTHTHTLLLYY